MIKVLYLASGTAKLNYKNVVYQDKFIDRDIGGDMLDIDLTDFDILIATPPCNWYSKANWKPNQYSYDTKHLLPDIIGKFVGLGKPFIVENVINKVKMRSVINNSGCLYYEHGRHSYFTNILIDFSHIEQINDNLSKLWSTDVRRQGGDNVNKVFDYFINYVIDNGLIM